jgi:putative CocE/NonD family hydrolase
MRRAIRWAAPLTTAALAITGATVYAYATPAGRHSPSAAGRPAPAAPQSVPAPPARAGQAARPAQAVRAAWTARPATYDVVTERDVTLRMSDGTDLVADILRPGHGSTAAPGRFPVIVTMTPYNKTVPGTNMASTYLVQRGYVQVIADVRGTGGSGGSWEALSAREQRDGKEIVEWAASSKRPWSNGRIGLFGASYGGLNQIFTAAQHPQGLKAIFPVVPMGDAYRDVVGTGGQVGLGFVPFWMAAVGGLSLAPPPTYSGADPALALKVLREHIGDVTDFQLNLLLDAMRGGEHAFDGPFYRERSPLEVVGKVTVPTYVVGGEFDLFQRGEPMLYQRLAANGVPSKFVYGPWYHVNGASPALGTTLPGTPEPPGPSLIEQSLRWFDHYVRGVGDPTLNADTPPVTYFENGSGTWRTSTAWPPTAVRYQRLRLTGKAVPGHPGALTPSGGSGGPDRVPWMPVAGLCTRSDLQWTAAGILGLLGLPCETDGSANDLLGVAYDTPARSTPLRLAGPVNAHLVVSSAARDGQLTVRVEDVAPGGKATQLTAGWQVLSLRRLDPAKTVRRQGLIVQPYHPYTKASATAMPANTPVAVDVEVFPAAGVIQPGHKLRISIQTADFAHLFPPLPQLAHSIGTGIRIWHDPAHPSWVALPVQP